MNKISILRISEEILYIPTCKGNSATCVCVTPVMHNIEEETKNSNNLQMYYIFLNTTYLFQPFYFITIQPYLKYSSMVQISVEALQKTLSEVVEYLEYLEIMDVTEKKTDAQKKGKINQKIRINPNPNPKAI